MTSPSQLSSNAAPGGERKVFPLSGITRSVGKMLDERAGGRLFWIRAEISQCSFSGKHAYLDLVEERDGARLAQVRGTIWGSRLAEIREALGAEFEEVLKPGREIVFGAHMAFHAVYGFSLNVQQIDLDALLGEMERRRKETLEALKRKGAVGRNAQLPFAEVPQRVILIGSDGTAGHTDFLAHLRGNAWGFKMDLGCIGASVQGASAVPSLVAALHKAGRAALKTQVDAVILLRGGGAKLDLDVFNDLTLCLAIAAMDVPVITGIGHETDHSLADVVAHTFCKTPTAVADFLLDRMVDFDSAVGREGRAVAAECRAQLSEQSGWIQGCRALLSERPLSHVRRQRSELYNGANGVVRRTRTAIAERKSKLVSFKTVLAVGAIQQPVGWRKGLSELELGIQREAIRQLTQQEERIGHMKNTLALLGPGATLKRGFSITRDQGKAILDVNSLEVGAVVETELKSGTFTSQVLSVSSKEDEQAS
jgi:exodeoxyribonuclease VII large subunit